MAARNWLKAASNSADWLGVEKAEAMISSADRRGFRGGSGRNGQNSEVRLVRQGDGVDRVVNGGVHDGHVAAGQRRGGGFISDRLEQKIVPLRNHVRAAERGSVFRRPSFPSPVFVLFAFFAAIPFRSSGSKPLIAFSRLLICAAVISNSSAFATTSFASASAPLQRSTNSVSATNQSW